MPSAFDIVTIVNPPAPLVVREQDSPQRGLTTQLVSVAVRGTTVPESSPTVQAVDEETDDDDDASEPEIVVPPTEPLETVSDFDEDDFDDDFDDDFEEEFEDDEFDSEVTPEDLEASDDSEDSFEDD